MASEDDHDEDDDDAVSIETSHMKSSGYESSSGGDGHLASRSELRFASAADHESI